MNKEEILARSRLENQNGDERELDAYTQGWKHAAKIGLLMCAVLMILEVFWGDSNVSGYWAVYTSIYGSSHFVAYRKIRKKSDLAFSIFYLICTLTFLAVYMIKLVD